MAQEFEMSASSDPTAAEKGRTGGPRPARELDRLPPPAFPPGTRRGRTASSAHRSAGGAPETGGFPAGALISPDEPIRRIGDGLPEGALISPDDPIAPSEPGSRDDDGYEVEVTGIGESQGDYYASGPEVRDPGRVADMLEEVARHLRTDGPGALLSTRTTSRFESTLRGIVAGYLLNEGD